MKTSKGFDVTVSSFPEEAVTTQEREACPTIPIQEYRNRQIKEFAVHYVRMNWVVETKATKNK